MPGIVVGIFVGSEKGMPMQSVDHAQAIAGEGLLGDRYLAKAGTIKKGIRHVTLIEEEAIKAASLDYKIPFEPIETRRNILTRNVALNHLVGKEFRVGDVLMRGVELCEPCGHLERVCGKKIKESLIHRGGLRAEIITSGTIRIGSQIQGRAPALVPALGQ
jgi:MOSC domain-containing protein YiiM